MKKSEFALQYYDLLNKCFDFFSTGQPDKYPEPDFSFYDKLPESLKPQSTSILSQQPKTEVQTDNSAGSQGQNVFSSAESKAMVDLATRISACTKCRIWQRTPSKCIGRGNIFSKILVLSYVHNENDNLVLDNQVYNLLKKMFAAIKINLDECFITNLIKCIPAGSQIDRNTIENCLFHLDDEIKIIRPKIIFALGSPVVSSLSQKFVNLDQFHGKTINYRGFVVFPTYSPLDILENPNLKKPVWDDLKKFRYIYDQILSIGGQNI